ncbi:transporter [Candidatus Binatia bacterium]|nr:transporter [Candidatus Binatia bacterium]
MLPSARVRFASFRRLVIRALMAAAFVPALPLAARADLTGLFDNPTLAGLQLKPLGPALANTVASTYPVASASSSVTYVYDPALETFERRTGVLGPIFGERTETIGKGQVNLGVSYSYVNISDINGEALDNLVNKPLLDGRFIYFQVAGGTRLADGRFTTYLPVRVRADLSVTAHIIAPAITYGITPDWDVNLALPVMVTSLGLDVTAKVPDPRLPQFALPAGSPLTGTRTFSESGSAAGIGDLLLRTKYVLHRFDWVDVAAGLGLSFPTGDDNDLQGAGTMRVQPQLILSHVFEDRIEPLINLAVDIDTEDASRSVFAWAAGGTARLYGPVNAAVVFLGRSQFSSLADEIPDPFFFQIERADLFDASVGVRVLFAETGVITANALIPLNDDGVRADVIPTVGVEYAFSMPW